MKQPSLASVLMKSTVVHTITYFVMGLIAFSLFNYSAQFAHPPLSLLMRSTDDPLVRAGVLFQPIRGILFGVVFYLLREVVFGKKNGWLILWITLVVVGIYSPFGAAPGSIEGLIYTRLSLDSLAGGGLEVLGQSFLLALLTCYWVDHPEKRWLGWIFGILFLIALLLPALGLLASRAL